MRIEASTPGPVLSTPQSHKDYRADIDGLRAVAACSIVLFHAFPQALRGGFVGVDIFFVISGYLIGKIILQGVATGTFRFSHFYARRIRRIFPALTLVLIACFAFGWSSLMPAELKELGKHLASGAGFVSNFALWSEAGYFDPAAEVKPLLHLWSLGIEEQFYIFWPLILWLCWRARVNALIPITVVCAASFALNILTIHSHPTAAFYSPLSRIWELLIGTLLAYQHLNKGSFFPGHGNAKSILGALLVGLTIVLLKQDVAFPGWWALLPTLGTYLLIDAGPNAWLNRKILSAKPMLWFGAISFPLYLWHWPLLSFARILELGTPPITMRIAAVLASVALAWLTYRLVESPLRFGGRSRAKLAGLCGTAALAGCVGYITFAHDGIPSRFPEEVRHIADFKYNYAIDARTSKCWLAAENAFDGFSEECIQAPQVPGGRSIFVWGDSHAARLYPGLRKLLGDDYAISQFTRDSCPPILNFRYESCARSNEYALATIRRTQPQMVILFAVWNHYQDNWDVDSPARQGLHAAITALKSAGIKQIVVLGPAPRWKDMLPKLVYQDWKQSYPARRIPERLATNLDPTSFTVDAQMKKAMGSEGVRFVSIVQYLCTTGGCLTHVPNEPDALLSGTTGT
ncbi:acyltransferase family protein [Cupriavidus basilensis]|uniref:acyltransferase family protein n=1 Tax=Cupriavidus basilensis TaxID=68895 RepID=UPI0039F72204